MIACNLLIHPARGQVADWLKENPETNLSNEKTVVTKAEFLKHYPKICASDPKAVGLAVGKTHLQDILLHHKTLKPSP